MKDDDIEIGIPPDSDHATCNADEDGNRNRAEPAPSNENTEPRNRNRDSASPAHSDDNGGPTKKQGANEAAATNGESSSPPHVLPPYHGRGLLSKQGKDEPSSPKDHHTHSIGIHRGLRRTPKELKVKRNPFLSSTEELNACNRWVPSKGFQRGLGRTSEELQAKQNVRITNSDFTKIVLPGEASIKRETFQRGLRRTLEERLAKRNTRIAKSDLTETGNTTTAKRGLRKHRGMKNPPGQQHGPNEMLMVDTALDRHGVAESTTNTASVNEPRDHLFQRSLQQSQQDENEQNDMPMLDRVAESTRNPTTVDESTDFSSQRSLQQEPYLPEPGYPPALSTGGATDLVRAHPVEDISFRDLPHATPETRSRKDRSSATHHGGLLMIVVCVTIVLVTSICVMLLVALLGDEKSGNNGSGPSSTADLSRKEFMLSLLPDYTIKALDLNFTETKRTPQTKAFNWTIYDPNFDIYKEDGGWRLVQRFALACFFYSTGGTTKWIKKSSWLDYEVEEYDWYFGSSLQTETTDFIPEIAEYLDLLTMVNAIEESDKLAHFWLAENGLEGAIPPEFFLLTSLKTIDLGSSKLTGSISSMIGNLRELQIVFLNGNSVSGTLPTQLGQLEHLMGFAAHLNNFEGFIPSELGMLEGLWVLSLGSSRLVGQIPSELGLLTAHPTIFWLMNNQLTGSIPSELGQLSASAYLDLHTNQLTGAIPSELGNLFPDLLAYRETMLDTLEELSMGAFDRRFVLSKVLEGLLQESRLWQSGLVLGQNLLTGTIPTELGHVGHVEFLDLSGNMLSGTIPSEIGAMLGAVHFGLSRNQLSGRIPSELGMLSILLDLDLGYNKLSGAIPTNLGLLSWLKMMILQRNEIDGTVPSELGNLLEMQFISLGHCRLSGPIPSEIGRWQPTKIAAMAARDTRRRLDAGCGLLLHGNSLTGTMPAELGGMEHLIWLELNANKLSGIIPTELGLLSQLREMILSNNVLSGSIPSELGELSQLRALSLGNNTLHGKIPSELGMLRYNTSGSSGTLKELDLSSLPLLSGIIPPELSHLTNLGYVNISGCHGLSGTIPAEFCYLQDSTCVFDPEGWYRGAYNCSLDVDCSAKLCGCDCLC